MSNWDEIMESLATDLYNKSSAYAWLYNYMCNNSRRWSDKLNILSGILAGIIGTAGLVGLFSSKKTPFWMQTIEVLISYAIGLIIIISNVWKLNELQTACQIAHSNYEDISNEILFYLAQPRANRPDAPIYVKNKMDALARLGVTSPPIDDTARAMYSKKFKNLEDVLNNSDHLISALTINH